MDANGSNKNSSTKIKSALGSKRLLIALVAMFVLVAMATAYTAFVTVKRVVAGWNFTTLPGISLEDNSTPIADEIDPNLHEPLQAPGGPTPQPWDGASRVSILIMGLDYRDWESNQGAPRTDTMLLLTIDPISKTGGMLSIPRDLWVNIPGFEPSKINTAYRNGEVYEIPGGGPALAMQTVEELLGVPVDFYALIDFSSFERFISELGGVEVEVPEEIKVDPLGPGNTVVLEPGRQTLSGEVALAYARARNSENGDIDRAERQQQVALAMRDRVLSLNLLPTLISKAPVLYQEIASGISTNLTLDQAIKLAVLALQISPQSIARGVIGPPDQVTLGVAPDGQDILIPVPDQIRILRDSIFTSDASRSPVALNMTDLELVSEENARVSVLNGTLTAGLASGTAEFLASNGLNVTQTDNASQVFDFTTLIIYSGKPYTVQYLVDMMNIDPNRIFFSFDPNSAVDVEVNLGQDWAATNPVP
ncbi:MAG TPA: LCP family protein [Anaerolineales bacterium]|nr:LCP family protein [Anaerolineales bacterium]